MFISRFSTNFFLYDLQLLHTAKYYNAPCTMHQHHQRTLTAKRWRAEDSRIVLKALKGMCFLSAAPCSASAQKQSAWFHPHVFGLFPVVNARKITYHLKWRIGVLHPYDVWRNFTIQNAGIDSVGLECGTIRKLYYLSRTKLGALTNTSI